MGKWKSIIEAGKKHGRSAATNGLEPLQLAAKYINGSHKPSDKDNEEKKEPALQANVQKVISRISNEYGGEAKHLEKVSKFLPQDTSVLRADIAQSNQIALEKLQEQFKDITTSTPKDLPEKSFEQKQIAGVAKMLGMTEKTLKERVKRNQPENKEPTKETVEPAPKKQLTPDDPDYTRKHLLETLERLSNPHEGRGL